MDNMTITISGRRWSVFSRHDNNNIGQNREVFSRQHDNNNIGQKRRVFSRHGNNNIGQNRGGVLKTWQ